MIRSSEQLMDMVKMSLFLNLNTFDITNINTILVLMITIFFSNEDSINYIFNLFKNYVALFNKKKTVILEGKRCFKAADYNTRSDQLFSDRFKAVWYYSIKSISTNNTIYEIKEYSESCNIYDEYGDSRFDLRRKKNGKLSKKNNRDFFIVHQNTNFRLSDDIWCHVYLNNEKIELNSNKKNNNANIETIQLKIFSNKYPLYKINNFIDEITENYIKEIQDNRIGKKFIYTYLGKEEQNDDFDSDKFSCWEECEFNSSRTFENLFFESKKKLIEKINFFKDNKDWYDKEGHPYNLGLGLSGAPGTGKTSIIKCLANMLNRNIIIIPLNKIKTQRELSNVYFESTYNRNNEIGSINFDNKIIVFEDIDCMSNIVKKRINNSSSFQDNTYNTDSTDKDNTDTKKMIKKLIKKINDNGKNDYIIEEDDILETTSGDYSLLNKNHDKVTLSYLLNLIDGIRETPGRILVITSNHYDKLDDALIRPGRIDSTLQMTNASYETICLMFKHYYKIEITEFTSSYTNYNFELLEKFYLSPAELVNIKVFSNTPEEFIENMFIEIQSKV